jgi:hypothetical protein
MKNIFSFLVATLTLVLFANAQITFNRSDYGNIGDKVLYAIDTNVSSGVSVGATGNINWDLRGIMQVHEIDSTQFIDPSTDPNAPAGTNLIIQSSNGVPQYQEVTDSSISMLIDQPDFGITGIKLKITSLPLTYLSSTSDSTSISVKGTLADFGISPIQGFDSVRIDVKIHTNSLCDAWGDLTLPDSSTHDCLRVKISVDQKVKAFLRMTLLGTWIPAPYTQPDQTSVIYNWFGTNSKNYLAKADIDTSGNIASFSYKITELPKIGRLLSITPSSGFQGQTVAFGVNGASTFFTQLGNNEVVTFTNADTTFTSELIYAWENTSFSSSVTIDSAIPTGLYTISVNDPVSGTITLADVFEVKSAELIPQLVSFTPHIGSPGQSLEMTITGKNSHFTQSPTYVYINPTTTSEGWIYATNFNAINDSTLTCTISIDTNVAYTTFEVTFFNNIDGYITANELFSTVITGVNDLTITETDVAIYPNPASNMITVSSEKIDAGNTIGIYDLTGRLIKSVPALQHVTPISVDELSNGIYYCTISGKDFRVSKKVVITKN